MATIPTISEAEIFADVIGVGDGDLSPEVAMLLLEWRFSDQANKRMNQLAKRNSQGSISDEEREQLQRYLRVGSFINILQAKARLSLQQCRQSGS